MQFQTPTNPEQAAMQQIIVLSAEQKAEIVRMVAANDVARWEAIEAMFPELVGRVWCEVGGLRLIVEPVE